MSSSGSTGSSFCSCEIDSSIISRNIGGIIFYSNMSAITLAIHQSTNTGTHSSTADELTKLGKLKEQGIITEEEFIKLKKDVLDRIK